MGQRAVQEFKGPVNLDGAGDLIGIRYLRYYPEKIFELPTGLTIYESKFKNIDGTRRIVGGPHPVFKEIEKRFYGSVQQQKTYLSQQYSLFKMGYQANPDISLLSIRENKRLTVK